MECPCSVCQLSTHPVKRWGHINVITATHVIFNVEEAKHATCRLDYNTDNGPYTEVQGWGRDGSDIIEDRYLLTCVTHDESLLDRLRKQVDHYNDICFKVYKKYLASKNIDRLAILVSHPHGCGKRISFGEWKDRYLVGHGTTKYSYTSATCPGSSGAPIYMLGRSGWRWMYYHVHSAANSDVNINTFLVINGVICAQVIGLFGIVANVINIRNFVRQGFRESLNITLTALAVSDLGALVTLQPFNVLVNPWLRKSDIPFSKNSLIVVISYHHEYFIRVSGVVTSFAAIERCLCVTLPLKVKTIASRKTVLVVNLTIYILFLLYLFPSLYVFYLDWKFTPSVNKTLLSIFRRANTEQVLILSYQLGDLLIPYLTFVVLTVCTVVTTYELRAKAKWRQSVTRSNDKSSTAIQGKQRTAVVMLTKMSLIFIVCLLPHSAMLTVLSFVRDLKVDGPYFNVALLCYSFTYIMEAINCCSSIFVYYRMSSKYRQEFFKMFPCLQKTL
ncbi:hypothetical protein Btru_017521 [Bulinus truncatus]|nr:hypothetical protein Btru_017521 [Bulinus truncatus]